MLGFTQKIAKGIKWLILLVILGGAFTLNQMAKNSAGLLSSSIPMMSTKSLQYGKKISLVSFKLASGREVSSKAFIGAWSLVLVSDAEPKHFPNAKFQLLNSAQSQIKKYLLLPSPKLFVLVQDSNSALETDFKHWHSSHDMLGYLQADQMQSFSSDLSASAIELKHGVIALVDPEGRLKAVFNQSLSTSDQLVKYYIRLTQA